jgi:atypical dual specificity phosphatase
MFFADKNIEYLKLDIEDKSHQSLVEYFDEVFAFIRKDKNTNVLIHCRSGMSRSASFVIAYIMKIKGATS